MFQNSRQALRLFIKNKDLEKKVSLWKQETVYLKSNKVGNDHDPNSQREQSHFLRQSVYMCV